METNYRASTIDDLARDERFRQWVIGRDPAAEQFWTSWLAENPDQADKIQVARAFLLALEEENTMLPADALSQITDEIAQHEPARVLRWWQGTAFRVAASVLLVLGAAFAGYTILKQPDRQVLAQLRHISPTLIDNAVKRTNTTPRVQSIRLEDGSVVQLYPNSTLQYPAHFAAASREVYLQGEAFFTIARNPKRPFWVYTNTVSTQVLGTSFRVSAFAEAAQAKVEVRSGRVSVYRLGDVEKARQNQRNERVGVILTPNQQVAYTRADGRLVKTVVRQPALLQPNGSNAFVFDEAPIADVFTLLEQTYGLAVLYDAATMRQCYLTADLTGEALFAKLDLICKITRSSYEIVDGQIVIHSSGCQGN